MTTFKKGHVYIVKLWDHNEAHKSKSPAFTISLVGWYKHASGEYYVFENWRPDKKGEGTRTVANIVKKAVIEAIELKPVS